MFLLMKILSSRKSDFTTIFTTNRQQQLAKFCSDLPQSVISEQTTKFPETLAKYAKQRAKCPDMLA